MSSERAPGRRRCKQRPRPRLQRYFLEWLAIHSSRLTIPLRLESRTDRLMTFSFAGLTRTIEVTLTHEIGVHVIHEGQWWDSLIFFEASPVKTASGFICEFCQPDSIVYYPSRRDLIFQHLFAPFLVWVNETLSSMQWLSLGQTECGGGRWADLHPAWRPPENPRETMIALRPQTIPGSITHRLTTPIVAIPRIIQLQN